MKKIHLLCIGKLNDTNLQRLEDNYRKRFKQLSFYIHELKSHRENKLLEAKEISSKLKTLAPIFPIFLTERGRQFNSIKFAHYVAQLLEQHDRLAFIIAGAAGFDFNLIHKQEQLSLSPLTFPHKIARLLIIEQLYRAETINLGHPYNK